MPKIITDEDDLSLLAKAIRTDKLRQVKRMASVPACCGYECSDVRNSVEKSGGGKSRNFDVFRVSLWRCLELHDVSSTSKPNHFLVVLNRVEVKRIFRF